jgi:predicted permease
MDDFLRDLRYGARFFMRAPGVALAAILSLGLGIGANTAIFSLLEALFLRPMPVAHPEQVVAIYTSDYSGTRYGSSSYLDFLDFREHAASLTDIAAYQVTPVLMDAVGSAEMAFAEAVSGSYFSTVGVSVALGRALGESDDRADAPPATVISHALWTRRFGSDRAVVGRAVQLNGHPFTVVGVAAERYTGALRGLSIDAWVPMSAMRTLATGEQRGSFERRGSRGLMLLGRLRPGVSVSQAQAAYDVIAAQLYAAYPQQWRTIRDTGRAVTLVSERDARVHPVLAGPIGGFMALLMVVVGLVLVTASANVANLLLVRGASRAREIGVRLALGSGRGRLIRQLLTESAMLAVGGGVAGLVIAVWVMDVLASFKPPLPIPIAIDLRLDRTVLLFTTGVSLLAGLMCGLAPALHASRTDIVPVLKDDASGGRTRGSRLRGAFVVAQVACSMLLLVGAALFVRSLQHARAIDVGFDPTNMVLASMSPGMQGYDDVRARALYERALQELEATPGVESASLAASVPLQVAGPRRSASIEGYQPQPGEDTETAFNVVGPRYFDTMRIAMVRGRGFTDRDRPGSPPVIVVNEAFARRYWPDADPIGKRVSANGPVGPFREVVGVTRTGKYNMLGEDPLPFYYLPLWQDHEGFVTLHVRFPGDPRATTAAVRDALRRVDASVPLFDIKTMDEQMLIALLPARLAGTLLGAFGILALLLASIGIYGVMAYAVAQRTREVGIRIALGAQAGDLLRLILGDGARLMAIGLGIGLAAAVILTRFVSALLYGITPTDPVAFAGAVAALLATGLLACYVPARRALRADPVTALRCE